VVGCGVTVKAGMICKVKRPKYDAKGYPYRK